MQLSIILLSLATAALAAPQLLFVLPEQFASNQQRAELSHESLVPVVVPIINTGANSEAFVQNSAVVLDDASSPVQNLVEGMNVAELSSAIMEALGQENNVTQVQVDPSLENAIVQDNSVTVDASSVDPVDSKIQILQEIPVLEEENAEPASDATIESIPVTEAIASSVGEETTVVSQVTEGAENDIVEGTPKEEMSLFDKILQNFGISEVKNTDLLEAEESIATEGPMIKEIENEIVVVDSIQEEIPEIDLNNDKVEPNVVTEDILVPEETSLVEPIGVADGERSTLEFIFGLPEITPEIITEEQTEELVTDVPLVDETDKFETFVQESLSPVKEREIENTVIIQENLTIQKPVQEIKVIETNIAEESFATEIPVEESKIGETDIVEESLTTEISVQESFAEDKVIVQEEKQKNVDITTEFAAVVSEAPLEQINQELIVPEAVEENLEIAVEETLKEVSPLAEITIPEEQFSSVQTINEPVVPEPKEIFVEKTETISPIEGVFSPAGDSVQKSNILEDQVVEETIDTQVLENVNEKLPLAETEEPADTSIFVQSINHPVLPVQEKVLLTETKTSSQIETIQKDLAPVNALQETVDLEEEIIGNIAQPAVEVPLPRETVPTETVTPKETSFSVQTESTTVFPVQKKITVHVSKTVSPVTEVVKTPTQSKKVTGSKSFSQENTVRGSGKSLNSNSIHINNKVAANQVAEHFGFENPLAVVMSQRNTFMHQGSLVDPKTLVAPQYRSYIFSNDSPDVIAAKVAFFDIQNRLTSSRLHGR